MPLPSFKPGDLVKFRYPRGGYHIRVTPHDEPNIYVSNIDNAIGEIVKYIDGPYLLVWWPEHNGYNSLHEQVFKLANE